jgi:hypothetical protein
MKYKNQVLILAHIWLLIIKVQGYNELIHKQGQVEKFPKKAFEPKKTKHKNQVTNPSTS